MPSAFFARCLQLVRDGVSCAAEKMGNAGEKQKKTVVANSWFGQHHNISTCHLVEDGP